MSLSHEFVNVAENIFSDNPTFKQISQKKSALFDYRAGIAKWRIWTLLAYQDIQLRYRRSILGPFWITLSMAITVYSMGYLYSKLFKVDLTHYYPFLVSGMLSWALISSMITDYTEGFILAESLIKQIKLPYTLYIHRIAYRNLLIFFHNIIVIVPILLIYHQTAKINLNTLILIPGLLVIYINAISFGLIISMLGARYRDIGQVIKSLLQVIFFVTPIMWSPDILGEKNQIIIILNPIYPFVELIRQPLLGAIPSLRSMEIALIISMISLFISHKIFSSYRARIVYWL